MVKTLSKSTIYLLVRYVACFPPTPSRPLLNTNELDALFP